MSRLNAVYGHVAVFVILFIDGQRCNVPAVVILHPKLFVVDLSAKISDRRTKSHEHTDLSRREAVARFLLSDARLPHRNVLT